jgi:acylphosphatase
MAIGKRVIYEGRVQGVGFRYTARQLADRFAVQGFVRNLPDGTVELVAEGEVEEVNRFLGAVSRAMAGYIDEHTSTDQPVQSFRGFHIRH